MADQATDQTRSRYNRVAPLYDLMDVLDPLVVRVMGAHISRRTAENVRKASLEIERIEELAPGGLVKLIVARAMHE
jgi:hypothetical protein